MPRGGVPQVYTATTLQPLPRRQPCEMRAFVPPAEPFAQSPTHPPTHPRRTYFSRSADLRTPLTLLHPLARWATLCSAELEWIAQLQGAEVEADGHSAGSSSRSNLRL